MTTTNPTTWLRALSISLVLGGVAWWCAGCTAEEHSRHHAQGGAYYDYDYYPDADVYFYPEGRVYYWYQDGRWRSGPRLPDRYVLHEVRRERLHVRTRKPWTYHDKRYEDRGEHYGEIGYHDVQRDDTKVDREDYGEFTHHDN